jgi:predicted lipase
MNHQTKKCFALAQFVYLYNEPLNWLRFPRMSINAVNYEIMIEPNLSLVKQCELSLTNYNTANPTGADNDYNKLLKFIQWNMPENVYSELVIKNTIGCQTCIFRDIAKNEIYVAVRGTDMPNDFVSNLMFSVVPLDVDGLLYNTDVRVHSGFLENITYNNIHLQIIHAINTIASLYNMKKPKIYISGHSLGGAGALLFSVILNAYKNKTKRDWKIRLYTYACPVIGNINFTNYVNSQINADFTYDRVITVRDIVPRLSISALNYPYTHPGRKTIVIYENNKAKVIQTSKQGFETITMADIEKLLYYHATIYHNALLALHS